MQEETNSDVQNTLLLAGGVALIAFGAGMLLANSSVRRAAIAGVTPFLPAIKNPLTTDLAGMLPDIQRYMRLKSM